MLKRIQTLYLAVSTALILSMFFCKFGTVIGETGDDAVIWYYEKTAYLLMNIMLLTANIFALFNFKNPLLQARISLIAAIVMIGFQIWLGVDYFILRGEMIFSVAILFPLLESFLNIMAARSAMVDGVTVQAIHNRRKGFLKRRK